MSFSATSPFWVSDQGKNLATLYRINAGVITKVGLEVAIPTTGAGAPPQGPTGQVNNGITLFPVNGTAPSFIFANLNGTISAWNSGTTATIEATTPGAVYRPRGVTLQDLFCMRPTARRIASMCLMALLRT